MPSTMNRVRLKKDLARSIRAGHPWIYADALEPPPRALATGSSVEVIGKNGNLVARGLYDAGSPIAVRVYTTDPKEPLDERLLRRRLADALASRRFDASQTNAYRWCNGEGDFLPGVVVDVYDRVAILRLDGDAVQSLRDQLAALLVELGGVTHVYERSRGGQGRALFGGAPPNPVEIREHGVRFSVDVVHGQKTGFFLDQRENRQLLRQFYGAATECANLFAYTGGFSVYLALGGATRVATVDSAAPALEAARANFRLNGLDPARHEFACEDAFEWLARQAPRFDLVITDPPSFAPSEKSVGRALSAYRDLNALALGAVKKGGLLAAASCSSHVDLEAFLGALRDAGEKARRPLRVVEVRGQPADHPSLPAFPEGRYLKFVLLRAD
jgi:23S rRNA (cytosine1962-C5)-methyltransferase